jgi:pimeloyl-ACP methyl ester carboxylesterase
MKRNSTDLRWRNRLVVAAAIATASAVAGLAPSARAAEAAPDASQILLVHGYGDHEQGKDCNGDTWKDALAYYQDAGGRARESMTTVGYYTADRNCDVKVGDAQATNDRPIQDIAKDLATYIDDAYTSKGRAVNIIGHSMGGLIARVALLGSAQGWDGFPSKLDVNNVVTLSTPHRGVASPSANRDRQWKQMNAGSGFIERLHEQGSGLGDAWAKGTDWSLVGSEEDTTVKYESGIDKGNDADQKYGYRDDSGDSGNVGHTGVRTLFGEDRYSLRYWHSSGDHPPHTTKRGWSPLKAAFQAATEDGDSLPK